MTEGPANNGRSPNGNGKQVAAHLDRIADSVWTRLATRALMIVGVPVIIYISNETLGQLARLTELVTLVRIDLSAHETRLDEHQRQLDDHEKQIGWSGRVAPGHREPLPD